MWRCFVRDQARVPSVAGAGSSLFRNRNKFFLTGTPGRRAVEPWDGMLSEDLCTYMVYSVVSSSSE